jgi:hypothetical protein
MIAVSRRANLIGVSAARLVKEPGLPDLDEVAVTTAPAAPSTQSPQAELVANTKTAKSLGLIAPSTVPVRADEAIE